jgi:glycosyltransferase involved in cell wall biosynthesis
MCRFYTLQVYDYVKEYDYILRLDDDSYIESPIRYDLFDLMRDEDFDYGYIHKEMDSHAETVATLPKFTRRYIREQGVDVHCAMNDIDALYYYTNFTVTRVAFWGQPEVQAYLRAVDQSLGIYQYRWGDHIIQTHALKMFSRPERIYHFQDFKYTHGSHTWRNYQEGHLRLTMRNLTKRLRRKIQSLYLNYLLERACRS